MARDVTQELAELRALPLGAKSQSEWGEYFRRQQEAHSNKLELNEKLAEARKQWINKDSRITADLLDTAWRFRGTDMWTTAFKNAFEAVGRALEQKRSLWEFLEKARGKLVQKYFRWLVLGETWASPNLSAEEALRVSKKDKTVVQSLLYFLTRYAETPDLWDRPPYGTGLLVNRPAEAQGKLLLDEDTRRDLEIMKAYKYDEGGPADTAEDVLDKMIVG